MYCMRCGSYNDEGVRFCTHCGSPIEEDAPSPKAIPTSESDYTVAMNRPDSGNQSSPAQYVPSYDMRRKNMAGNAGEQQKSYGLVIAIVLMASMAVALLVCLIADPFGVIWRNEDAAGNGEIASGHVYVDDSPSSSGDDLTSSSGSASSGPSSSGTVSVSAGDDRSFQGKSGVIGNLINGGHFASSDDGYLYYCAPVNGTDWDTRSIVRCNPDGSNKATVYSASESTKNLYHLNVVGDRLVFNQVIENSSAVISVHADGTGQTTLDSCDDWSLCQVDDGWVYYLKSGRICRCDVDGRYRSTLSSVGSNTYWRIAGDKLFTFSTKGAREIFSSELDGSKRGVAYSSPDGYEIKNSFPIDSDTLIVWETATSGKGTRVLRVGLSSSTKQTVWTSTETIERVCAYDSGIIITRVDSGGSYRIMSVVYDSGKVGMEATVTSGDQARYTSYVLNRVYYGVISSSNACSIRSLAMTGETMNTIM